VANLTDLVLNIRSDAVVDGIQIRRAYHRLTAIWLRIKS